MSFSPIGSKWPILFALLSLLFGTVPAVAAVEISFYSREFGASFPHAFIELKGTDDRTGEAVHANYGFTAKTISPAILLGSVTGAVMSVDAGYVRKSDRHVSFVMTDVQYDAVRATIKKWENLQQPSYNLNLQNCVYFVANVAASVGMRAETPKALMKKPRSFTQSVVLANQAWLTERGATFGSRYTAAGK